MELELKLSVPSHAVLEQIIFDKEVAQVRQGGYRLLDMATVYYDTGEGDLSKKRWTLRLRQENDLVYSGYVPRLPCRNQCL